MRPVLVNRLHLKHVKQELTSRVPSLDDSYLADLILDELERLWKIEIESQENHA